MKEINKLWGLIKTSLRHFAKVCADTVYKYGGQYFNFNF